MGVMLPFVSACLGPTTRGCFMMRPSVLNLFWRNVAASGVGKSETRKRLVSEPLEYIFSQEDVKLEDFEVSKFTRAGEYSYYYKVFQRRLQSVAIYSLLLENKKYSVTLVINIFKCLRH